MTSSRHSRPRLSVAIATCLSLVVFAAALHPAAFVQTGRSGPEQWVGTWATALYATPPPRPGQSGRQALLSSFSNQTLRQIARTSIGGERVRVVLSNVFGTTPLVVGAARIALRTKEATIAPGSDRELTFSGSTTASVPPRSILVSDPVSLTVSAFADLAVDLYLPGEMAAEKSPFTLHDVSLQSSYLSAAGNHAGAAEFPVAATIQAWFFLARVEVAAEGATGAVVTVGDSITNGTASTIDANNRWPDHLARRLAAAGMRMAVLNTAIDGNRLLTDGNNGSMSALARFDRDVLGQTGATHVIVLEGVNDLRNEPETTAADLIAGHRQLVERAHARGLKILGGTMTPAEGGRWTPDQEAKRQALNTWIRTSGVYDGIVDFDAAVRDPAQPARIRPSFDSGGGLHPNDTGYASMGAAVDLALLSARSGLPVSR